MTAGDVLDSSGRHPERVIKWPPSAAMLADAQLLAMRVTQLLTSYAGAQPAYSDEPKVRSGYRPPEINATTPGASKNSNHMYCRAVDLEDIHGHLGAWCMENLDLLAHFELWLEDPRFTPTWVHLQSVPPRSLSRVFQP